MKHLLDLDAFVKTLKDKGYNGYFHTEGSCAGELKDSISGFLENWKNDIDAPRVANFLHLSTYLQWNGEDKPKVQCNMRVRYENGKFDLEQSQIHITRTDRYGQLLKESKLTKLTADSVPTVKQAISMVSEKHNERITPLKRGFRM
jgi:hypothetical protein